MNNPENERKEKQLDQLNSISGILSDAELLELMYENGLIDLDEKYLAKPVNISGHKDKE